MAKDLGPNYYSLHHFHYAVHPSGTSSGTSSGRCMWAHLHFNSIGFPSKPLYFSPITFVCNIDTQIRTTFRTHSPNTHHPIYPQQICFHLQPPYPITTTLTNRPPYCPPSFSLPSERSTVWLSLFSESQNQEKSIRASQFRPHSSQL